MLKKHNHLFLTLMVTADLLVAPVAWMAAYLVRFDYFHAPKGIPPIEGYLKFMVVIVLIWGVALQAGDLYKQMRSDSRFHEYWRIVKTATIAVILIMAAAFFYREYSLSRMVMALFWLFAMVGVILSHGFVRGALRRLRAKGYNLRYVLIVGAGELGGRLAETFSRHPESGLKVVGLLADTKEEVGKRVGGLPVIGVIDELNEAIRNHGVDQIFVALPRHHMDERFDKVMDTLQEETVDVKLAPDVLQFMALSGGVEDFDGIPIISLSESPMYGWNRVIKRVFDIVLSTLFIVLWSPVMIAVALLTRLESPGPIVYRQERMSLGGEPFTLFKFRSMRIDAETTTGAVWASKNDDRTTRIGKFIRKTSLDELPQLFNVLRGDMSLVGPRPERPIFVDGFKKDIPRYMLRHKMKAGMSGWAQVNGWRGNTDLTKRIEYDLYYIENWSLLLDVKILWLTIWKGFINDHAY
jgi:Undecaprenyl-phosphate glucose phosphotransferase